MQDIYDRILRHMNPVEVPLYPFYCPQAEEVIYTENPFQAEEELDVVQVKQVFNLAG